MENSIVFWPEIIFKTLLSVIGQARVIIMDINKLEVMVCIYDALDYFKMSSHVEIFPVSNPPCKRLWVADFPKSLIRVITICSSKTG